MSDYYKQVRKCTSCNQIKSALLCFRSHKRTSGWYLASHCRDCELEKQKIRRSQRIRKGESKRTNFGLTRSDIELMLFAQNFKCAICLEKIDESCHTDHDHNTGKIRDLLCRNCNVMLGYARENPSILQAAIKYLEYWGEK